MDYIILDIEFNGRKFASEHPMEVIEIGAVRLDASLRPVDEFTSLIRPVYFATLNSFIKKKTGIPQEEIDIAPRFPKVISAFRRWLDQSPDDVLLLTWGGEDMKRIIQDTRMHKMDDTYWMKAPYYDLLKGLLRARGLKNDVSVEGAMELLGLESAGSAHRALGDARMTSDIFRALFGELDLDQVKYYKDTFSNARERKTVKIAIKAILSQKIVPTWELVVEHYFAGKVPLDDPRKAEELQRYFDAELEKMPAPGAFPSRPAPANPKTEG
ncbi:inhibitor of KinA sporulation pathway (predicted exonuclease) [Paenibacillus forsythiae]|uniref:Inhibitor of KinA sporulation pathway (Predicted exonuclease) n=1 Tax=Paenibacillus forsythiae TaxID=365616 RepID=A0ABU3H8C7_9BACL|nr:3'-5' exonuclease [Paenibacillus forsythiae]MDT3427075.1 inhibitor of KinA sporulation pathway (predicted exonuclease) [Paenibacillus forsythiae]